MAKKHVTYHLVHINTSSTPAAAATTIVRDGRIIGAQMKIAGAGGASAGYITDSLELNNTGQSNADTGNPPRETFVMGAMIAYNTTTTSHQAGPYVPLDIPVRAGDILSINQTQIGTAPGTNRVHTDVFVLEND